MTCFRHFMQPLSFPFSAEIPWENASSCAWKLHSEELPTGSPLATQISCPLLSELTTFLRYQVELRASLAVSFEEGGVCTALKIMKCILNLGLKEAIQESLWLHNPINPHP